MNFTLCWQHVWMPVLQKLWWSNDNQCKKSLRTLSKWVVLIASCWEHCTMYCLVWQTWKQEVTFFLTPQSWVHLLMCCRVLGKNTVHLNCAIDILQKVLPWGLDYNALIIHFNIILQFMPRSSQWSLFCRYPYQNPFLPHICYMPCYSPYLPGCNHLNSVSWWAPVMKCLIIQFGEQWKSWSASSYNFMSSANREVPHHTIWWAYI